MTNDSYWGKNTVCVYGYDMHTDISCTVNNIFWNSDDVPPRSLQYIIGCYTVHSTPSDSHLYKGFIETSRYTEAVRIQAFCTLPNGIAGSWTRRKVRSCFPPTTCYPGCMCAAVYDRDAGAANQQRITQRGWYGLKWWRIPCWLTKLQSVIWEDLLRDIPPPIFSHLCRNALFCQCFYI